MSGAGTDLIAGYLAELRTGLWVSAAEAELIVAEAEDHLRETAAAGMAIGMTELEAHEAAISSFGPVRAVIRAYRRRTVTAGDAVLAAWKLTGLLAAIVGAGGLAAMFVLHSPPIGATGFRAVQDGPGVCQCSISMVPITSPAVMALPYAALAAGGLALLALRRLALRLLATRLLATHRLAWRGTSGRNPLSPAVTASFFLLVTALMFAINVSGVGAVTNQSGWLTPVSSGSVATTVPLVPGAIVAGCLAMAVGYGLQTARRLARRRPGLGALARPGRDPLAPAVTASFFLLVSALMFALNVSGAGGITHRAWLNLPLSSGSATTAVPLVPGVIVAGCLGLAVGCGLQASFRLARREPGSAALALPRSGSG
ncbi:MAG: permease prefix domain 1-containing protein [Streptosporangiaceae bacterium]